MPPPQNNPYNEVLGWSRFDFDLVFDSLRFSRDYFCDDSGNTWDEEEYSRLVDLIDEMEPYLCAKFEE